MPTGIGATNPKFAKSVRKPKKIEHCTIPEGWQRKVQTMRSTNEKRGMNNCKQNKSRRHPKE